MRTESLRTKVYTALRQDIVSGKIPGGTRITEVSIADSLKVSRTPVREALQKLSQERLLISIPKAGYMVEDLSDDDIQDLFSTRMEIEQIAIKKAIKYISAEELKALDDNLEKTKTAIKSKKDLTLTELDVEFHSIIYTAARSRSLFRVCKNLGDLTLKYRHGLNLSPSLRNQLLQNHIQIYQAMISKDISIAVQAMENHGKRAKEHLLVVMKKIRSDSFSLEKY
ncbi:MAG: GntR family transcriptional regulator [Pseudomonadota bacterium]